MNDMDKVFDNFGSYDGWLSYAEAHYLPLLDRLSESSSALTDDDRRLLGFLHDDIIQMINNRG